MRQGTSSTRLVVLSTSGAKPEEQPRSIRRWIAEWLLGPAMSALRAKEGGLMTREAQLDIRELSLRRLEKRLQIKESELRAAEESLRARMANLREMQTQWIPSLPQIRRVAGRGVEEATRE